MKIRNIILTLAILLTAIIIGTGKIDAKEKTKTIGNFKYSY